MPNSNLQPKNPTANEVRRKKLKQVTKWLRDAAGLKHGEQLKAYHRIGGRLNRLLQQQGGHGKGAVAKIAREVGCGANLLYKTTEFARRYDAQQLQRLIKVAPNAGYSHVIQLISVADIAEREKLEAEIGARKLKVRQLMTVVKNRHGSRRSGGRPMRGAAGPEACRVLLGELQRVEKRWRQVKTQQAVRSLPMSALSRPGVTLRSELGDAARAVETAVAEIADLLRKPQTTAKRVRSASAIRRQR